MFEESQEKELRKKWTKWYPDVELQVVYSEYRTLIKPLVEYISEVEKENPNTTITVIVPQFIVKKWWQTLLHNQSALFLRFLLILKKDIVISTIPFHLHE